MTPKLIDIDHEKGPRSDYRILSPVIRSRRLTDTARGVRADKGVNVLGKVALGMEVPFVGDLRRAAAVPVLGPGLEEVELTVDQSAASGGGVGGEDPDLAGGTPFGGFSVRPAVPEYWRCTPAEVVPFLTKPVSSMIRTPSSSPRCSAT
ncbi:hypothetical protein GCM10027073_56380 [Streptomyces chlorus]